MATAAANPATTNDEREAFTPIAVDEMDERTRCFKCPHCQTPLQFNLNINVRGVYELNRGTDGQMIALVPRPPSVTHIDPLSKNEREIIEKVRECGILDAFQKAVTASGRNVTPRKLERYFLTFILRATPTARFTHSTIKRCLPEPEPAGTILKLWQLDTTCAITANGQFRAFVPIQLIKGQSIASLDSLDSDNRTIRTKETTMDDWIKTRHGYITNRGPLMSELTKRAAGSFDNLNISK